MLHIVHLIERRFPGNAGILRIALVLASAGLIAAGLLLAAR